MTSGRHNNYHWIQWESTFLDALLRRLLDIVLGRYLINTSYDSGVLPLSDEERQQGWRTVGKLTCSPRITDVRSIPHDQYDEWLVFREPAELQAWQPLINCCGMSLTDPDYRSLQEELWSQIESVRPESYLAEGDRLFFITRDQQLHELALKETETELEDSSRPFATAAEMRDEECALVKSLGLRAKGEAWNSILEVEWQMQSLAALLHKMQH